MAEPVRDWTDLARASVTAALKHLFPSEHFITRQRDVERDRGRAFMYRQAHRLRQARQQGRSLGTQVSLEDHYSSLRERERAKRTALAYAADALRQTSPLGAYWVLNPYKKVHCPLCLFMAGQELVVAGARRHLPDAHPPRLRLPPDLVDAV